MWKRVVGLGVYGVFCLFLLSLGSACGWIGQSDLLKRMVLDRGEDMLHIQKQNPFDGRDSLVLLVLGCDEDRYFGGEQITRHQARSDMILLCKLDFKNNRISGISIPRDTLVAADGHTLQKINRYHVMHGNDVEQNNEESKKAVETLLPGIQVDRVMALNFDAFKQMVDAVGGIDIYVPKNMDYDDQRGHLHIHLKQGRQHLDGGGAEGFVRFRHADNDFQRTGRQHDFMLAYKDAVIHHPLVLPTVTNKAVELTSHALSVNEIATIAEFVQKVGNDNIKMGLLPTLDANDGQFGLIVDAEKSPAVLAEFHFVEPEPTAVPPASASLDSPPSR